MAMDRIEQIGLGSAIGGHALLLILLSLGVFGASEHFVRPKAIEVSLVGEIGPEATSPDPSDEAPAPMAEMIEMDSAAPAPDAAPDVPTPQTQAPPVAQVIVKPRPKPASKPKPRPIVKKRPAAKKTASKPKRKPAKKSGGFGKGFENRISGIGKGRNAGKPRSNSANGSGSSASSSSAPGKSASVVRRSVNAALASQIRPYLQSCAPSGVDIASIRTFITLSLNRNGSLSSVRFDKQRGINASNKPQAEPLKQCALKAARQASPYRGLDPKYHNVWKNHAMQLKAR